MSNIVERLAEMEYERLRIELGQEIDAHNISRAEIEQLSALNAELLAALNLARICLKNRDQSEYEAKAYAAIRAVVAKAEGKS